jgi:HEAT repeat protein
MDPDHAVRRAAISALAFAAGPAVATPILAGLSDAHWQVREAAAVVAGRVLAGHASAETAIDGLIEALSDEFWQVRGKAALTLGKLKVVGAISALGDLLSFPVSNLRKDVVTALGEIGHRDALPFLESVVDDADPDVRKIARWSIRLIRSNQPDGGLEQP